MSCCNGKCEQGRACPQRLAAVQHAEGAAVVARARRMHLAKVAQYNARHPIDPAKPDVEPAPVPLPLEPGLWAHVVKRGGDLVYSFIAGGLLALAAGGLVHGWIYANARWFA